MRITILSLSALLLLTSACEDPSKSVQSAEVKAKEAMAEVKGEAKVAAEGAAKTVKAVASDTESGANAMVEALKGSVPEGAVALSPKSSIGFVGSKVTGSHTGSFPGFKGYIKLNEGKLEGGMVNVVIDMTKVESDNPKLTGHLKSDEFFDIAKFPTATFKTTKIAKKGDGLNVTGDLTLHGVTKSIAFDAKTKGTNASTEFSIDRKDFGITYPGKKDDLIRDGVVIKLDLVAAK